MNDNANLFAPNLFALCLIAPLMAVTLWLTGPPHFVCLAVYLVLAGLLLGGISWYRRSPFIGALIATSLLVSLLAWPDVIGLADFLLLSLLGIGSAIALVAFLALGIRELQSAPRSTA
ncbi:hypothetical protein Mal4_10140 [Maioricimonas rarisocia]|uniref:Uncharacterized protein n=1 Tax=Maioricimonas rarisocia TaxID=2528026 RepID=A0A517Z2P0_9PLAN|nr:hypothetical protein [Maioricimonas rarisocia]QDU36719.1 hypothetical protein Mal4_10140 [Maioricimonas rarisocia]